MYKLSYDTALRVYRIELEGFWSSMTMARFAVEVVVKGVAFRARYRHIGLLVDCTAYPVQSGSVIDRFGPLLGRAQQKNISPIAIVIGTTLCKLQAERLMPDKSIRVFTDLAAAQKWIGSVRAAEKQAA